MMHGQKNIKLRTGMDKKPRKSLVDGKCK